MIRQILHSLIGLALTAMSLFLVVVTGGAIIGAILDRDGSTALWAVPGLFVAGCCTFWSMRLTVGRRRRDGGLLSPRALLFAGLLLAALAPIVLLTGLYETTGRPLWFMVLLSILSAFAVLGYSLMAADRRYGTWAGIARRIDRAMAAADKSDEEIADALVLEEEIVSAMRASDEVAALYCSLRQIVDLADLVRVSPRELAYGEAKGARGTTSVEALVELMRHSKAAEKYGWDLEAWIEDPQRIWDEWNLGTVREVGEGLRRDCRAVLPDDLPSLPRTLSGSWTPPERFPPRPS